MPTTTILSTVTKKEITKQIVYSEAEIKAILANKTGALEANITAGSDGTGVIFTVVVTELKETTV